MAITIIVGGVLLIISVNARSGSIVNSRHDLSHLNERGYGTETGPMQGATFNDYRETCIYCHTPHNSDPIAPLWNRNLPERTEYKMYSSPNFNSKAPSSPDGISLACLSCHDGTVAVDSVRNKPKFHDWLDSGVHYRMSPKGDVGSDTCGKCHNRTGGAYGGLGAPSIGGAHDATIRYLTKDLRDDHPISIQFPSFDLDPGFNQPSLTKKDGGRAFPNGVQTFEGDKVQCASCHDIHNPDEQNIEGRDPFLRVSNRDSALCLTCHQK
ncbi:MAG: hypothetical protein ACE5EA_04270 [Nitrospirota bacterium]